VVLIAQGLMIILDMTIVNVSLPSLASAILHLASNLACVVNS